jgi:hypothetical protein
MYIELVTMPNRIAASIVYAMAQQYCKWSEFTLENTRS